MWVEWYTVYLKMLASHGFFVIGVDYAFPAYSENYDEQLNQDISKFFAEIDFVRYYLFWVQSTLVITTVFVTKDFAVKSNLLL